MNNLRVNAPRFVHVSPRRFCGLPTSAGPVTFQTSMSATAATPDAAPLPSGMVVQPAGPVLRQIGQAMGLTTPPTEQLADLPPWPQEDADAFERSIEEVCEQIDP